MSMIRVDRIENRLGEFGFDVDQVIQHQLPFDSTLQYPAGSLGEAIKLAASESTLKEELSEVEGSDLVGYNKDATYQEGTVGSELKSLSIKTGSNQGASKIGFDGTNLYDRFKNVYHVSQFGIVGTSFQENAINEGAKLQAAIDYVAARNGCLLFDARNYYTDRTLVVTGTFRSIKLQGVGTGNSQTSSSAGTTILTNGTYSAIRAEFNVFANENICAEGLCFYNIAMDKLNGGNAIHIVRGNNNSRYISGFVFRDIGIRGFAAGFTWQGMNIENAGLNYFGHTIMDNVSISETGVGFYLLNASLNLFDLKSVLLHSCPYGGIRLERDGAVGAGNGKGSSVTANIHGKSHFEDVGGMFRTQTTRTYGGTGTSEILRSTIRMDGLRHEFCGDTTNPTTGNPFALGVDTDIIITGDVDYGMGYGENAYGVIPSSCTVTSSTPVRLNIVGTGRSLSPRMVNAPIIAKTIANGASATFTVTANELDKPFALKSQVLLSGGQAGFIESMHRGIPNGAKATTSNGSPTSGITAVFGNGSSGDVISLVVTNNSGFTITAELQVENISSCTTYTPSSY